MPSAKILEAKKALVKDLNEKIVSSLAGVVVAYNGISVADDTKLRKELREAGVHYMVVKNTMLRLAVKGTQYEALTDCFKGDTAIAKTVSVRFFALARENAKYLRKRVFRPYLKMLCMRLILFYQKHLSKHTCLYRPTCSQYTLECINNHGALFGILLGAWRILRCNPFSKGGYDPAPENYFKRRWVL